MQTTDNPSVANPMLRESGTAAKSETVDRIAGSAHQAVDRIAQRADGALESLRNSSGSWREASDQSLERVQEYVRERPFTALGAALAVGFLLSRLMR